MGPHTIYSYLMSHPPTRLLVCWPANTPQPGEAPGTVLDAAARILDERVRSEQPAAAAVLADLLQSAAAAAAPLLEAPA